MVERPTAIRLGIALVGIVLAAALAVLLYAAVPLLTDIGALEVTLGLLVFLVGSVSAIRMASRLVAEYDVAEVAVDDIITRDGSPQGVPVGDVGLSAEDIVEQIEKADDDDAVQALIVRLNTPGGAVVPSEDIRRAVSDFDGPTVAYAEDIAASGGYWIAAGADEFHARRGATVGSIGVNGTQLGRTGLAEKVGLEYRRFVAGDYKDTPSPWRDLSEDEEQYVEGLLDEYYEQFVETVVEGRDLDAGEVRDTEARVYLGETAADLGLVDYCGPRDDLEERLADRLDVEEITVEAFEPQRGLGDRISVGLERGARAFGAGLASAFTEDGDVPVRV
jgi:protease-4